ncbi:tetracycline-efflux transporter [Anaeramoeba flamelloides]|uniref:Tetracycline-efflux transporter n=1 Tax=Anaeramoeba flamelloides TaxID=1746091 RepID=A0AAV7YYR6_9EUKA|nr:tetracycline-efflux transporter [Anaeramoeba flamelloides]
MAKKSSFALKFSTTTLLLIENFLYWVTLGITTVSFSSFFITDLYHNKDIPAATNFFGICETLYYLTQLFGNSFFSIFSDRYGRKTSLVLILFASSLDWFILSNATTPIIILISRMMHGFSDSSSQVLGSYLSELVPKEEFSKKMGLVHGCGGAGMVFGLILAFILTKFQFTNQNMFLIASILTFIDGVFVSLLIPESKREYLSTKFEWKKINPTESFKYIFKKPKYKPLIPILFLNTLGGTCCIVILQFYLKLKFQMSDTNIYYLLFQGSIFQIFSMGFLLKISIKKRGNKKTLTDALIAQFILNLCCIFARKAWFFFLIIPLIYHLVSFTIIQSFFQSSVEEKELDMLFGSLSLSANLVNMISKYIYPLIFSYSTKNYFFPEAPFILALVFSAMNIYYSTRIHEEDYFSKKNQKNIVEL